jgi:predicted dehydrogenase
MARAGGPMFDWGCHAVDYSRFITGLDVVAAQACGRKGGVVIARHSVSVPSVRVVFVSSIIIALVSVSGVFRMFQEGCQGRRLMRV